MQTDETPSTETSQTSETTETTEQTTETKTETPAPPDSLLGDNKTAEQPSGFGIEEVSLETLDGKLPEGFELVEEDMSKFLDVVNSGTSRADIVEKAVSLLAEREQAAIDAQVSAWNEKMAEWQQEAQEHPEFGRGNFEKNLATARTLVETYAPDPAGLKDLLKVTGIGNSVAMIGFLTKLAEAIPGEGKPVDGTATPAPTSLADKLFGNPD